MTTKKSQTAKAAPKATKTVKTTDGKTKTMPAKKPASKPTKTTTTTTKAAPKKQGHLGRTIACIVGALSAVALVTIVIVIIANNVSHKSDSSLVVENGDGEKITTKYVSFNNGGFQIKVPDNMKPLEDDKLTEGTDENTEVLGAYINDAETVSMAVLTNKDAKISNDQLKEYLDAMKTVFETTGSVLKTDYYTKGDYNVGTMRIALATTDNGKILEDLVLFSQDGQLMMVNITYDESEQKKIEPVNDFIIRSLEFLK